MRFGYYRTPRWIWFRCRMTGALRAWITSEFLFKTFKKKKKGYEVGRLKQRPHVHLRKHTGFFLFLFFCSAWWEQGEALKQTLSLLKASAWWSLIAYVLRSIPPSSRGDRITARLGCRCSGQNGRPWACIFWNNSRRSNFHCRWTGKNTLAPSADRFGHPETTQPLLPAVFGWQKN